MSPVMDPAIANTLGQLAATAIWTVGQRAFRQTGRSEPPFDREAITASIGDALTTVNWSQVQVEHSAQLHEYFVSPEFATVIFHLTEMSFAGATDLAGKQFEDLLFGGLQLQGVEQPERIVRPLLFALLGLLKAAIPFVDTSGASAAVANSNIASIELHARTVNRLTQDDVEQYKTFARDYRAAVSQRTSSITPPDFEDRRRIEFDDLYVSPTLSKVHAEPSTHLDDGIDIATFIHNLDRAVLLGDPGGGKSTLARKVALELTRGSRSIGSSIDTKYLPVLVVLRNYAERRENDGLSLVQYLESHSQYDYQLDPPQGVFDWLLQSGQCVVILDGLDELLDTSVRVSLSESVESFAALYPACPILVTSRRVGYSRAPLDSTAFETFHLAPFNQDETIEYANNWFSLDESLNARDRSRIVSAFVVETRAVHDLTSNPLLLSLMCAIYRGESYIPRNRPEVYEKCALLLFDRWDRRRGIAVGLPFEAHVDPLMKHLALWLYRDGSSSAVVPESKLIDEAASYLESALYSGAPEEARLAASQFVEYCCGRAWVFTDVGSTASGERLFSFTHRTFMEYFAAAQLARKVSGVGGLLQELLPRIRRAEWDQVSQMAIHIFAKAHAGASEELCRRFVREALKANVGLEYRFNAVLFGVRCLEFLVPPRVAAEDLVSRFLEMVPQVETTYRSDLNDYSPVGPLAALDQASQDNRDATVRALNDFLARPGSDVSSVLGQLIILGFMNGGAEGDWLWTRVSEEGSPARNYMIEEWRSQSWIGRSLVLLGEITAAEWFASRTLEEWFEPIIVPGPTLVYLTSMSDLVFSYLQEAAVENRLGPPAIWMAGAVAAVEAGDVVPLDNVRAQALREEVGSAFRAGRRLSSGHSPYIYLSRIVEPLNLVADELCLVVGLVALGCPQGGVDRRHLLERLGEVGELMDPENEELLYLRTKGATTNLQRFLELCMSAFSEEEKSTRV